MGVIDIRANRRQFPSAKRTFSEVLRFLESREGRGVRGGKMIKPTIALSVMGFVLFCFSLGLADAQVVRAYRMERIDPESAKVVAHTKVMIRWIDPLTYVNDNPFSQHREFSVPKGGTDLIQRIPLDMTRISLPPDMRTRSERDAKQMNPLAPLRWDSGRCQIADLAPNGSLQLH
jgi:hypothetical protein